MIEVEGVSHSIGRERIPDCPEERGVWRGIRPEEAMGQKNFQVLKPRREAR